MDRQCQDARQDDSSDVRQKGDNETWRQKREARMAMTTTMIMMTCVIRTITSWSQRHDGDEDDSRIVTTGRWRRWLEHDVETVTTTIAGPLRPDGDDDTTGTSRQEGHYYDGDASSVWQRLLEYKSKLWSWANLWIWTIQYKIASKTLYRYVLLALMRVARQTAAKSLVCSSIGQLCICSVTTTGVQKCACFKTRFHKNHSRDTCSLIERETRQTIYEYSRLKLKHAVNVCG